LDANKADSVGRWPANLIHDGSDEVVGMFPDRVAGGSRTGMEPSEKTKNAYGKYNQIGFVSHSDNGSAARFFYCAKASRSERGEGNNHPTVKPTALMRYLCRLVTPPGGTVLDPFCGSGSTGKAAVKQGFRFIGIELNPEYSGMAVKRIESVEMPLFE
jgi:site-specific DNA-methyltransferase (adenine-specific)